MKKLLIRTWFGPLPPWHQAFQEHIERLRRSQDEWDFMLVNDLDFFKERVRAVLGIQIDPIPGSRKAGDYDPYYGAIFATELRGYEFWGHYNLDAVYGRLDHFLPNQFLNNIDIFGNDPGAICGPFSIYRNTHEINWLFRKCATWEDNLRDPNFRGWDELDFSRTVVEKSLLGEIRFASGHLMQHDKMGKHKELPLVRIKSNGSLWDYYKNEEIMMYHFNRTREWPVIP